MAHHAMSLTKKSGCSYWLFKDNLLSARLLSKLLNSGPATPLQLEISWARQINSKDLILGQRQRFGNSALDTSHIEI